MFVYQDNNNKIICLKTHKGAQLGNGSTKWYLGHKIAKYSTDKPLYICEGEKDVLTLLSDNKQAISVSIGCNAMPSKEMLELIKDFKEIYVCYDNDKAGIECGNKLGEILCQLK